VVKAAAEANRRDLQAAKFNWRDSLKLNRLSNAEEALAYSRLYSLLSGLYVHGLTRENLESVRMASPLAAALTEPVNLEEAAADHQHQFGFNVFPYASAFLDPSGLLGGAISDRHIQEYQQGGYRPRSSEGADHIGNELGFIAHINRLESSAWTEEDAEAAHEFKGRMSRLIDNHIFPWLAPFALAVRHQGNSFFIQVVDLTLESLDQQRRQYGRAKSKPLALPKTPPVADDNLNDIKNISSHLLTPLSSGIFLSRDDIGRLAQRLTLPRGFGQRRHMIENLFESAITYEQTPNLLSSLQRLLTNWEDEYRELAKQSGPTLQVEDWLSRVKESKKLISQLAKD